MACRHFSSRVLALIAIFIAINMIDGQLASTIKLPILLDFIDILISVALPGLVIGILIGLLTNLLWGLLTDPIAATFASVVMAIGLVAGWLVWAGWFRTLSKVVVSGVVIAPAVTVVAASLRTALFGGVTGNEADLFVAWTHLIGQNLVESVAITAIGVNLVDKILAAAIVWLLLRQLSIRITRHFPAMAVVRQIHPFTSLTLWALVARITLILSTQIILLVYSAATFFCPIALKATRRRAKYVVWLMFSLGAGLWLVRGGWLIEWLSGTPRSPEWRAHAITLWLRILAIVPVSQLRMQYVPVQRFIRASFVSRLPSDVVYLFAGPLLVIEQLKRQLATTYEAQRARGVPLDEGWYRRLCAMPALIIPLAYDALNDLAVRGAALDMRTF